MEAILASMRAVCIRTAAIGALAAVLAVVAPAGGASGPPTPWDGVNPFQCELQQAGFGAVVPHPEADPYCVEFDKRRQNVTELGFVDFMSKEPARVAAASDKCFYFQSDHWRGSVVQGDGSTKTYEWDGHYFFDKARGEGGVWVTNFNFNGQTGDPRAIPGFPPEYGRYFGPGTGGFITHNEVQPDPRCVARTQGEGAAAVYSRREPRRACFTAAGTAGAGRLGPIALGETEARVRDVLGEPPTVKRGFLRYCVQGGSKYLVGLSEDRSGELGGGGAGDARVVLLLTTHSAFRVRGVARGSRQSSFKRAFKKRVRVLRQGRTDVYAAHRRSEVLVGVRLGRVRFLAVRDRAVLRSRAALADALRRSQ